MNTASRSVPSGSPPTAPAPEPPWRIEIFLCDELAEAADRRALERLAREGVRGLTRLRQGRGYLLSGSLERATVERVARELLQDPVLDRCHVEAPERSAARAPTAQGKTTGAKRVVVARKRGVMDPVALSIERALARARLAAPPTTARETTRAGTYRLFELEGTLSDSECLELARRHFANDVVDDIRLDARELELDGTHADVQRPLLTLCVRGLDDAALLALSRDGQLSLNLEEMRAIQRHYGELGRDPTVCEIETLAQTWSEHCKHKTFTGRIAFDGEVIDNLLKDTIKRATVELDRPWCVSVFHDNAGIVEFLRADEAGGDGKDWNVCFKVETHNHPSAIDPFGGAGTGVGGVVRDILGVGLGAKPIANTDAFFVGPLDLSPANVPRGAMHPARILTGVVSGVRDYGNPMGIPTVNGGLWSHPGYVANPLVFAGTVGLLPAKFSHKSVQATDLIVVVGGRTGRDGVHGATFSSIELAEASQTESSAAVQIGDPITEKRVLDALLAARDLGLYRAVTDCGAGGLSSAVGEMGEELGARVELERVPLKYQGLLAHEIWISEAQERMVLAVPKENLERLCEVFAAEDCEATPIGEFVPSGKLELFDHGQRVAELDMRFLHQGTPRPLRQAARRAHQTPDLAVPALEDPAATLLALLAHGDISSREWILRQYDHEVQGTSVQKPLVGAYSDGPGNACVLQPVWGSSRGVAIACGAQPRYGLLDPGAMALAAIDEALRNATAVGGDPTRTAILDNFAWGSCEKPEQLGDLVLAARACYAAAKAYGTPFISGKDSLNNEYKTAAGTLSIPPTLYVSALSIVPDVARSVSMDLKRAGNAVYLIGMTHAELGGSALFDLLGRGGGAVPRPDLALAPEALRALARATRAGWVRACHDLSEGGLAVAAAEMAFAGDLGLELDLAAMPLAELDANSDARTVRLFAESCTRFLVEVEPDCQADFEACFEGLDLARLGHVDGSRRLKLRSGKETWIDLDVGRLRAAHQGGFKA